MPPSVAPRNDLLFGFYGNSPGQTDATHGFTNLCGAPPWEQSAHFTYIQECVGHGLPVIVDITYVLFSQANVAGPQFTYLGEGAKDNLRVYLAQLQALGLLRQVAVIYPIDEPDLNVIEPDMCRVTADIRVVLAEFHVPPVLAVIYNGERSTPGAECFDWIGRDKYINGGPQSLPLLPGQRLIIVAGGADPYRQAIEPYEAYANSHPEVVAVLGFAWFDYSGGLGIAHNSMLPEYRAAGCRITRKCEP